MSIVFFGSDYRVVEEVLKVLPISTIVIEKRAINRDLVTLAHMRKIKLSVVSERNLLAEMEISGSLGISCGFGLIFKKEEISNFSDGIMNIHYGRLPINRGRHPLSWAYLMNSYEIWVSFHMINEEIDKGRLLHEFKIIRSLNDDLVDIGKKILENLSEHIVVALENIKNNGGIELSDGVYRPNLSSKMSCINPADHDSVFILNAIRSQKIYGGVEINKRKCSEAYVYNEIYYDETFEIVTAKDGIAIMVR